MPSRVKVRIDPKGATMAKPLDPKEIVTVRELVISNTLEIEALRQLLFDKGIISEEEFIGRYKKLDREMKEKRGE